MIDVVSASTRSRMMAAIKGKNTKPEIKVRKALHGLGFRFGRTNARLPGKPDIILSRWKVAVFVNGCFWHWHGCHLSKLPTSNNEFWLAKLNANRARDSRAIAQLQEWGWRVVTVWECAMRGSHTEATFKEDMRGVARWIRDEINEKTYVVSGTLKVSQKNNENQNS